MPKLLQINVEANYGSTGRIAESIGNTIINDGWESCIAYGQKHRDSNSNLLKVGNNIDLYNHILATRLLDKHGYASKKSTQNLITFIKEYKPDIIQLHNIHGYYLNYPKLFNFLAQSKIPTVWTFHDCWPVTGHCVHFENIGCEKWKKQCYSCPQTKTYPASLLIDRSKKNYNHKKNYFTKPQELIIITVSEWLNNIVSDSFLSKFKRKTIHNGIDTNVFKPKDGILIREKFGVLDCKIILGVASNWNLNKGLNDFVDMSSQLPENYRIVLLGLSKKQIEKMPNNVIGLERTQNLEELVMWYSTADVYVNPSLEESFGMTTIEAMACGTPAIVYNATASPELIDDKVGLVVEKGNGKGLFRAINQILAKPKSHYSKNCRKHVVNRYNYLDKSKDYLNLYRSILEFN